MTSSLCSEHQKLLIQLRLAFVDRKSLFAGVLMHMFDCNQRHAITKTESLSQDLHTQPFPNFLYTKLAIYETKTKQTNTLSFSSRSLYLSKILLPRLHINIFWLFKLYVLLLIWFRSDMIVHVTVWCDSFSNKLRDWLNCSLSEPD